MAKSVKVIDVSMYLINDLYLKYKHLCMRDDYNNNSIHTYNMYNTTQ